MTDKQMMTSNAGREVGGRGLVPVGETPVVLPATLAGEVDELTGRFAERIGEGLMAASVAISLDVLDQMMRSEVTGLAAPWTHRPRLHVHGRTPTLRRSPQGPRQQADPGLSG
jgi:hypothetical protein